MKRLLVVSILLLLPAPSAWAQTSLIGDVATERAKYGPAMSREQVAQLLNAVAWNHRFKGWGLLRKGSGNSCPLGGTFISCDILIHAPSVQHFDVLRDAENTAIPQWGLVGPCVLGPSSGCDMSNFLAPVDPGGAVPTPTPYPTPYPTPVPAPVPTLDLTPVLTRLDAIYAQAERIYADLAARDAQIAKQLEDHDKQPGMMSQTFGNRYVQLIAAGLGAYFAATQTK